MKTGLTISASAHAVLLLWGMMTFGPRPLNAVPPESMPIDIVSTSDFSKLVAGSKTAPKAEKPKPLVEKVAEPKAAENPAAKVVDKPEIVTASALMPEPEPAPVPTPRPARPAPAAVAETQPKVAPKRPPEPKRDPIAEAIKQEQPKKPEAKEHEPRKKQAKVPTPPRKPPPPQPKFDANRIAALLDKRTPQRQAATGQTINHTPTLGAMRGDAQTLSQSEIDALRAQIQACWNPPAGIAEGGELVVQVKILLRQDGSLAAEPMVINRGANPSFQIAAESAMRAVRRCQPYRLPIAKYDVWKDVEVTFDPRDMYRG